MANIALVDKKGNQLKKNYYCPDSMFKSPIVYEKCLQKQLQRLRYSTFFHSFFEKQRGRTDLSLIFAFLLTGHSNSFHYLPLILLTAKLSALGFHTKACSFFNGYVRERKKEQKLGVDTVDLCLIFMYLQPFS